MYDDLITSKLYDIEFSFDMTLREFFLWLLNQELWKFLLFFAIILIFVLLYKIWETTDNDEPNKNNSNKHILFDFDNDGKKL